MDKHLAVGEKDKELNRTSSASIATTMAEEVRASTSWDDITPDRKQTHDDAVIVPPDGLLGKVLSKTMSGCSIKDPGPPPDGGLQAWLQVLAGHMTVFNIWGYINTFGVFQTYYTSTLGHPPSDISWLGSVQIFFVFFVGTFSGRATDAGLFRPTYIVGNILLLLGVFMTSISTKYWHFFLAQGVCTGIGMGLLFCPTLTLVSTYFSKRRSLATATVASGTGTGGIVYPIIVQQLLNKAGFGWTVRVIGFVMLAVAVFSFVILRTRLPPRKSGPIVEWTAFREPTYILFCIGAFFTFWGLYFAFYYVGAFGKNIIHISVSDSINLLLILNGVGLAGRIVPAYCADAYFGPLNIIIPFAFISALLLYCWAAVNSRTGLIAFSIFYGIFAAGIQGLFPSTLASLTSDLKKTGVRMGMCFSVVSFASLTGPPLAGALIQQDHGGYLYAQMFAGSSIMTGVVVLVAARWKKVGLGIVRT